MNSWPFVLADSSYYDKHLFDFVDENLSGLRQDDEAGSFPCQKDSLVDPCCLWLSKTFTNIFISINFDFIMNFNAKRKQFSGYTERKISNKFRN